MSNIVVQLIGFAGTLFFIISFQMKSNRTLMLFQTLGICAFIIQFVLLGGISGCFGLILTALRNVLLQQRDKWPWVKSNATKLAFFAAGTLSTILSWSSIFSILPWIAFTVGIYAFWKNDARIIRLANLFIISPAWLTYDLVFHSYGGVLNELLSCASILVYFFRFGWGKQKEEQSLPD